MDKQAKTILLEFVDRDSLTIVEDYLYQLIHSEKYRSVLDNIDFVNGIRLVVANRDWLREWDKRDKLFTLVIVDRYRTLEVYND